MWATRGYFLLYEGKLKGPTEGQYGGLLEG